MDSPLLSPGTETSETRGNMFALPPPLDPNESCIVPVNESPEGMPSDRQQYRKNPSIYRVPDYITNLNDKAHKPQVVSLGPYHHHEVHLRPMEEHKHRACDRFLERSRKSRALFLESLREVAQDLEESYSSLDSRWKEGTDFLELLITDGCFMLEFMRTTTGEKCDYPKNDPIFNKLTHIKPYIERDMLMLENQLPMLVLYHLVAVENNGMEPNECINETNKLILSFYSFDYSLDTCIMGMGRCLHVLDIYRKRLLTKKVQHEETKQIFWSAIKQKLGSAIQQIFGSTTEETEQIIRSATELNESGIQFKKSPTDSLKDITFAGGVLKLPVIPVDDATKSMFLNLMTFERLYIEAGKEISSYIFFMDNIINNDRDVALLQAQGIIRLGMGSDKEVARLFNSLCKEVTLVFDSSLYAEQEKINKYCVKRWNKWRATLNRDYFGNPWALLSLLAAIFLFTLTIIQAVYAVLSYY